MQLRTGFHIAGSVAAVSSAVLWWWSARVKTPTQIQIDAMALTTVPVDPVPGSQIAAPVSTTSDDLQALAEALRQQSRLNRWAALLTAAAIMLQVIAAHS